MKDPYSDLSYIHPLNKLPEPPAMIGPSCVHCKGKHLGVDCIYRPKKISEKHDFNKFTTSEDAKLINYLLKEKSTIFFGGYMEHKLKNIIFDIDQKIFINDYKK